MRLSLRLPPSWLREARSIYEQYVFEWEREELERCGATDGVPEPPQSWPDFLSDYHYAELENSVWTGVESTDVGEE